MEIWKNIPNYEGLYQISNLGRIKTLERIVKIHHGYYKHIEEKIIDVSKRTNNAGYLYINLWKNGKQKNFRIHRLVAEVFLKNPNNYKCVNHKDNNKLNNNVENLEWCTQSYNIKYAYKKGNKEPVRKYKKVKQLTKDRIVINYFNSIKEAQEKLNITGISGCCRKKNKTAGGYIWEFA